MAGSEMGTGHVKPVYTSVGARRHTLSVHGLSKQSVGPTPLQAGYDKERVKRETLPRDEKRGATCSPSLLMALVQPEKAGSAGL